MNKKIIAGNALSQNLARILKNDDNNPRILLKSINDLIEKIKKNGVEISIDTIMSWMEVGDKNSIDCKKWPSRTNLKLVAAALNVDYLELYIPDSYLKFSELCPEKRSIINSVLSADDGLLLFIKRAIAGITEEAMSQVDIEHEKKKDSYKRTLSLLDSQN